jgi:hypothetical protein
MPPYGVWAKRKKKKYKKQQEGLVNQKEKGITFYF